MNIYKCKICGYTFLSKETPNCNCTKCNAPTDSLALLTDDEKNKLVTADRTNDIHAEIITLASKIISLTDEGLGIKLDPACVSIFESIKQAAWQSKQLCRAEISAHSQKGKW